MLIFCVCLLKWCEHVLVLCSAAPPPVILFLILLVGIYNPVMRCWKGSFSFGPPETEYMASWVFIACLSRPADICSLLSRGYTKRALTDDGPLENQDKLTKKKKDSIMWFTAVDQYVMLDFGSTKVSHALVTTTSNLRYFFMSNSVFL